MLFLLFPLFLSFVGIFILFRKKLLSLLMLELSFSLLIFLYFFFGYNSMGESSCFFMMLFLGFMVMDSVLGLCCLIVSSRNSSPFMNLFLS